MNDNAKGFLLIFLSAIMFATYGVWSKLIGNSFDPFFQGWTRGLLLSLALLPILIWKKELVAIPRKDWFWLIVFLIFTSFTQAPLFYAFIHMDIGSAILLYFCSLMLTMYLVGFLFFGEKITKVKAASFILAAIGMYFVFSFSLVYFSIFAAAMAILNGFASGGEITFSKKLTGKYSTLYISWLSWVIILITNGITSLALGETQLLPSFDIVWVYMLAYALVSAFGFWFVMEGLKYVEAGIGALMGLLEIVFSIVFGIVIFQEHLTPKVILGASLIIIAAAIPHIHELITKTRRSALSPP